MKDIKIYKMNDCECWATKWSLEETVNYYNKDYGEILEDEIEFIEEVNIDNAYMWWDTEDEEDIKELGESDEYCNGGKGDLMRRGNTVYKTISYREALERWGDFEEPFMISTTEW